MEKTDIVFYSFDQFGCSLLHIGGNGDLVKVFRFQTKYLKDKAFIYLKETRLFSQFQVTFQMYLEVGRTND